MSLVPFWFIVIAILWTGFFVLEGFDFGVGMLHDVVGTDEAERRAAINTIGPLWDGNEVCELVKMPTAPISPAMASRPKKLGEYTAPPRMAASTISHTGTISLAGEPMAVAAPVVLASEASTCSTVTAPS